MIELYEGVPGAGKSYHAVSSKLLEWVRRNRRLYIYVEGFYLDKLALFEGREPAELEQQITLWPTQEAVMGQFYLVALVGRLVGLHIVHGDVERSR